VEAVSEPAFEFESAGCLGPEPAVACEWSGKPAASAAEAGSGPDVERAA
jgi:hypothetical protein